MRLLIEAENIALGVADGHIVAPRGRFDVTIRIPRGQLRPGLINAHDHLHRNHYGRLGVPPYANAYEWGRDIHKRDAACIARGRAMPRREALLHGAWKNLRSGVTTVVHHDPAEPDFASDFPIRVASLPTAHSLGVATETLPLRINEPFAIHLAEGTDELSAEEIRELERRGLLTSNLVAVHVVGADDDGIARFRGSGAALTWCPTSNAFLFGRTVRAALVTDDVDVLIGSDSRLTGQGSLLDEIRFARVLGLLSDSRVEAAVGAVAARRLGLPEPTMEVGARADLVVLMCPLLEATDADVALVVCDGVLRLLDPTLCPQLGPFGPSGRVVQSGQHQRWIHDGFYARRPAEGAARHRTAPVTSR
jgi:Cytosine deaminase and related metal-dependent hydrolases